MIIKARRRSGSCDGGGVWVSPSFRHGRDAILSVAWAINAFLIMSARRHCFGLTISDPSSGRASWRWEMGSARGVSNAEGEI